MANVSAIFLLPVLEKSSIFSDCQAVSHSISAQEGGNTVCWKAMARKKDSRRNYDVLVPFEAPYGETTGHRIFVTRHKKMGSSARSYGPRLSVPNLGSTLRATSVASFGAFPRKHYPNVRSALRASAFEHRKCPGPVFFCLFDVRLAVSDVPRSTPTTLSVVNLLFISFVAVYFLLAYLYCSLFNTFVDGHAYAYL